MLQPLPDQDELVRQNLLKQMGQNQQAQGAQAPQGVMAPGSVQIDQPAGAAPAAPAPAPAAPPSAAYRGQLQGFDANKMSSGHISPKYVFAQHAQNYNVTDPASRDALLKALQADPSGYFKNASWGGSNRDRLVVGGELDPKYGGINTFDVIKGASRGGEAWQWGPEAQGGGGGTAPGSSFPMGGDVLSNISQLISQTANSQDPSSLARQFLLQFLQSQQGGQ